MTKLETIEAVVCYFYGVRPVEIRQKFRMERYLLPRQITIYLYTKLSDYVNKPELMGKYGLNRATYYNCIKSVENRKFNADFRSTLGILEQACEAATAPDAAD